MNKKTIAAAAIILGILLSIGYAVRYYFPPERPVPSTQAPEPEPVNNLVPNNTKMSNSIEETRNTNLNTKKPAFENKQLDKRSIAADKGINISDKPADLSEHTMSIKREENKGYEITPGVNVKSGTVHVQLDKEDNRSIELERNPQNSNSDYQVMMKKKF